MLPKSLQRYSNKLSGGMDVDSDGWKSIWTKPGWQFNTDPWSEMHYCGEATVKELVDRCKAIIPCECADCKKYLAKEKIK